MKKIVFLLFILLLPLASAIASAIEYDYFDYQTLELKNTIKSDFSIIPESSNYYVDNAEMIVTWFPKEDYRQKIISFKTGPESEKNSKKIVFDYGKPSSNNLDSIIITTLETSADYVPVKNKISFPIKEIDSELAPFIDFYEITDVNQDIYNLANELSEGKDDLFEVVFSFADWIDQNINYSLDSITEEASQPSSWVLNNRYGVCDEISSLFISLNRAVGIPAKFVSGIAYTDLDYFEESWGLHGWVEVYFPEIGWVPFDVTYEQMGWIDATHIKMQDSIDSSIQSVNYNAEGNNFHLEPGKLDNDVEVTSKIKVKEQADTKIDVSIAKSQTGIGSYNLISVDITNLKDYYITKHITLAGSESVTNLDDTSRNLLLKPRETKKELFLVKIDEDLDAGYSYTFTGKVYAGKQSSEVSYMAKRGSIVYQKDYFNVLEEPSSNKDIIIECTDTRKAVLINQTFKTICKFTNLQNRDSTINICLDNNCQLYDFKVGEIKEIELEKLMDKLGVQNLKVEALNARFSKNSYILVNVIPGSIINIKEIKHPDEVRFENMVNISFLVSKKAYSKPTNIQVLFEGGKVSEQWNIYLEEDTEFSFEFPAEFLKAGSNLFQITVNYNNDLGQQKITNENFKISLVDVTLWEKIKLFIISLST